MDHDLRRCSGCHLYPITIRAHENPGQLLQARQPLVQRQIRIEMEYWSYESHSKSIETVSQSGKMLEQVGYRFVLSFVSLRIPRAVVLTRFFKPQLQFVYVACSD